MSLRINESPRTNESAVLVATVLASGMAFIDTTALNVVLPAIQEETSASAAQLLWIINSYALVAAGLIFFGGAVGDHYGRGRIFAVGIVLFVLASLGCSAASSVRMLIATRTIQGFGAALMIPGSLSLISTQIDPSRRGRAIGIWSACSVVMTALGPILGGWLADLGCWRAIFLINLPIGTLALFVLFAAGLLSSGKPNRGKIDLFGALLGVVFLVGLNYGLIEAASRGWADSTVLASLLISVASAMAFLWNESASPNPLLPLAVFRQRSFVAACQLSLCLYSSLYGTLFFVALNLIQVQNYTALAAGLAQLPVMLLVIVLSPLSGSLVDRHGPRLPLTIGGAAGSFGFLWLAQVGVTSGLSQYWTSFLPPLSILGIAMGMTAAPLSTTIINSVPTQHVGIASGINSTLSRLAAVLGVAVLGSIVLISFTRSLLSQAEMMSLGSEVTDALRLQSHRLADTAAPDGIPAERIGQIDSIVRAAYVDASRVASLACAAIVAISTFIASRMLRERPAA